MAKYIECPKMWGSPSLFMGGGISGCPDWQAQLVQELKDVDLVLVNPRRKVFDVQNAANTRLQIRWEYLMLRRCDGILFWFPCESICPIVLFELGTHLMAPGKPLFIGMHPEYQRRIDVEEQTSIIRPDIEIVYSIPALAGQVRAWESRLRQLSPYSQGVIP
jgi:hypothetical protein